MKKEYQRLNMKCENCGEDITEEQYSNFNRKCPHCNRAYKNAGEVSFKDRLVEIYKDLNTMDKVAGIIAIIVFVTFVIVIHSIFG